MYEVSVALPHLLDIYTPARERERVELVGCHALHGSHAARFRDAGPPHNPDTTTTTTATTTTTTTTPHLLKLAHRTVARPPDQARLLFVRPGALAGRRRRRPRAAADGVQLLVQPRRLLLARHEGAPHGRELTRHLRRHELARRTCRTLRALRPLWPLWRRRRRRRLRWQGRQRGELLRVPLQSRHHLEQRRVGAARLRVATLQLLEVLLQLPAVSWLGLGLGLGLGFGLG